MGPPVTCRYGASSQSPQKPCPPATRTVAGRELTGDLLTRRVIDRDGEIRQLVPEPRRQRHVDFHPFRPARRADLECFRGLAASGDRVPALRADQPIRNLAAGGTCLRCARQHARRLETSGLRQDEGDGTQLGADGRRRAGEWRRNHIKLIDTRDHVFRAYGDHGAAGLLLADVDVLRCRPGGFAVRLVVAHVRLLAISTRVPYTSLPRPWG